MWPSLYSYKYVLIIALSGGFGLAWAWLQRRYFGDPVVEWDPNDPEIVATVAHARSTLPDFWSAFEAPGPDQSEFALKVRFARDGTTEHLWCEPTSYRGNEISGTVVNNAHALPYRRGQPVRFDESAITDWCYRQSGRLVGGETMRLMLKKLPARDARAMAEQIGL